MNRNGCLAVLVATMFLAATSAAMAQEVCEGVTTTCSLEDLGNNRYRLTFITTNGSPGDNVVFKWELSAPRAPSEWETVGFSVPPDWTGNHPNGHLDFQTPNGDFRTNRIYSTSAAADCTTQSSHTFQWTFDNKGGPTPDCGVIDSIDYTYHMQGVNPPTCENVGQSFVCPGPLPIEPVTWGAIKNVYRE